MNGSNIAGRYREVRSNPSSKILRFDRHSSDSNRILDALPGESADVTSHRTCSQTLPRSFASNKMAMLDNANNIDYSLHQKQTCHLNCNREFADIPPHVFRITAEIAEYQERDDDIRKMRTNISKHTKKNIRSELNAANSDKGNIDHNGKQDEMTCHAAKLKYTGELDCIAEHSKVLQNLRSPKNSAIPTRSSLGNQRCPATTTEGVPLRKPVLAKGFDVQKALKDNPRYFHITAPTQQPSSHSTLGRNSGQVQGKRGRHHQ